MRDHLLTVEGYLRERPAIRLPADDPCIVRSLLLAILLLALGAPAAQAAAHGRYLDFGERPDFVDGKTVVLGPEHVPQVRYAWGVEDNPVMVATGPADGRARPGSRARPSSPPTGWPPTKLREAAGGNGSISPPPAYRCARHGSARWRRAWASACWCAPTTRPTHRYLTVARKALLLFVRAAGHGGVTSRWDDLPWYEEYPGVESQHVLNGYEFALLGLHDFARASSRARRLWRAGIDSLAAPHCRVRSARSANAVLRRARGGHYAVDPGYRHAHALLTTVLGRLSGILRPEALRGALVALGRELARRSRAKRLG